MQNELGTFDKMTQMINSGSPSAGTVQVRFNVAFRRKGQGNVAKALPLMGGKTNKRVASGAGLKWSRWPPGSVLEPALTGSGDRSESGHAPSPQP